MNKRTASMLVMAAGMACVAGCAEWRSERADTGYRSVDEDARYERTDVAPRSARTADTRTTTTTTTDGSGSYTFGGDPQGGQQGVGATTTSAQRSGAGAAGQGTGSYTMGGDPQGAQQGRGTMTTGSAGTTGSTGTTSSTGTTRTGTGATGEGSYTIGGGDTTQSRSGGPTGSGYDASASGARSQTGTTAADARDAQRDRTWPRDPAYGTPGDQTSDRARTDTADRRMDSTTPGGTGSDKLTPSGQVAEQYLTGEVHDHDLRNRSTPAAPGDRTTTTTSTTRTTDGRAAAPVTTDRDGRTRTDGRADHDADVRDRESRSDWREARDTSDVRDREDPYGVSPDAFGSSPWSPANRGVRIVRYDRRAIEPLQRETSWQAPSYTATTQDLNRSPEYTQDGQVRDQAWARNQASVNQDAQQRDRAWAQNQAPVNQDAQQRDRAWAQNQAPVNQEAQQREGNRPDALAAQPGADGKTKIDATLMGISPDARILSILNAKDAEEIEMGRLAQSKGASADVRAYGQELERDHSEHAQKVKSIASSRGITLLEADKVKEMMKREKDKKKADGQGYMDRHDYNQSADRDDADRQARDAAAREAEKDDARAGQPDTRPVDPARKDAKDALDDKAHKEHKDHDAMMTELRGLSGSEFDRRFAEVMLKGHRNLIEKVEKCREDVTPEIREFLDETLQTLRKHEQTAQRLTAMR